ncbi:MAG: hypothetical protein Q8Q42_02250 [Nanoarchaeota archaeon]|nr:hypothetical protein [Nanoarchaeota archaeon]
MKKKLVILTVLIALLVVTLILLFYEKPLKEGLDNYPDFFLKGKTFNGKIVVDDKGPEEDFITAQNFLEALGKKYKLNPDTLIQYGQLDGLYNSNAIFIGTCNTIPKNKFVNIFMDCLSMEKNVGMIRLVENNNVTIVQVVGYDYKDTREAIDVLINSKDYNLAGREVQVRGDLPNLEIRITG